MYYIYHIPGIKIGCTSREPAKRVKEQGYSEFEILEAYYTPGIAATRELELQKEYGYKIDNVLYGNQPDRSGVLLTEEHKDKIGKAVRRSNTLYKELSSGLVGSSTDLIEQLGCSGITLYWSLKNGPITQGKSKGLHFIMLEPGARR